MKVLDQVRIIIYRMHEKGLEIFIVPPGEGSDWYLPYEEFIKKYPNWSEDENCIELEPIQHADGTLMKAVAFEADWHEIPSVRGLVKKDLHFVRHKIEHRIEQLKPHTEKGAYVAFKEVFKKVLPHEYAFLKELKDIILDRNLVKNI